MKKDKMYPTRVSKEKLEVVIKYCRRNKTTLSKKIQGVIDSLYDDAINEEKVRDQIIKDSKVIRENFKEIRRIQNELKR